MKAIRSAFAAMTLALAAMAAVVVWAAPNAAWAQSWQEYRPDDGKFFALMPGRSVVSEQRYDNGGVGRRLLVELANDEAYLLEWTDYPSALSNAKAPEQHLREAQGNAMKAFANGKLLRESVISAGQWPGRAFMIDLNDGMVLQANHYWVGNRLYQLIVVTGSAKARNPAIPDFFGAFRILQR